MKPILKLETKRLKKYEHLIFKEFEACTIISESDRNLIANYNNEDISVIPNGVDFDYFTPRTSNREFDILFTGNMSYPPNIISVEYLIKDIMPLVWKVRPETTLVVSGANPTVKLRSLESKNVKFTGWVEDMRDFYGKAGIFVAPMKIGSGLQNKLLEAMAMKLPCISSELANKSLGAIENDQILIGSTDLDYAEKIIDLLHDSNKANDLAAKGYEFVKSTYSWEKSNQNLEKILFNNQS